MTTHIGNEGTVKIGSDVLAELKSWSFTESAATADDSAISDAWDTHLIGSKNWKGQATAMYDPDDDDAQGVLVVGASVTLNLYGYGTATGNQYFTGTATVTEIQTSASRNGVIEAQFSFTGNGALSRSAAS